MDSPGTLAILGKGHIANAHKTKKQTQHGKLKLRVRQTHQHTGKSRGGKRGKKKNTYKRKDPLISRKNQPVRDDERRNIEAITST